MPRRPRRMRRGRNPAKTLEDLKDSVNLIIDHAAGHPKFPKKWCALCEYTEPNSNSPFQKFMREFVRVSREHP